MEAFCNLHSQVITTKSRHLPTNYKLLSILLSVIVYCMYYCAYSALEVQPPQLKLILTLNNHHLS